MTEAMSRHEIEDVLTSIRKLVSQDANEKRARQEDAAPASPLADKLVLTSALRVDDGAMSSEGPATPPPEPAPENAPSAMSSLLTRIQNAGAARASGPAARAVPDTDPVPASHATSVSEQASGAAPARQRPELDMAAPDTVQSLEDAALEATLSRLEEMFAAAPQTAARQHATPQPAAPEASTAREGAQPEAALDQVIDEKMLYQLVAQIVRQELQGELGEKITRNIRKLVRSEVARELALRKL